MTIIFAKRYFVTVSCARLYQTYFPLYVRQAFAHRLFTVEEENAQGAESKWKGGGRTFRGTVFIDKKLSFLHSLNMLFDIVAIFTFIRWYWCIFCETPNSPHQLQHQDSRNQVLMLIIKVYIFRYSV